MTGQRVRRKKTELLLCDAETLPTLPGVARRLLPVAMEEPVPLRNLQQAIECDASLAAHAIRLAVRLGHSSECLTSIDAILRAVPVEAVAADLLSVSVVDKETLQTARLAGLWHHNLAVGVASQIIAIRLGSIATEDALLAGILHDIGQVVLAVKLPLAYGQVLDRVEKDGVDILEAERSILGLNHTVLGRRLAQHWGFPETLQNVIWLHHQTQVPIPGGGRSETLVRVVHLADVLARQAGFSYHGSEEVRENTAEAAERLGLSGVQTGQIARQLIAGVRLNTGPAGIDDAPSAEQLCELIAGANTRLGRLYSASSQRQGDLEAQTRQANLMVQLNTRLAGCSSAREVLQAAADAARKAVDLRLVVPYLVGGNSEYVEGLVLTDASRTEEPFLFEVSEDQGLNQLLPQGWSTSGAASEIARAERIEGWLFERMGPRLGEGPFYSLAMTVEGRKVGGIVFALRNAACHLTRQETNDLASVASIAGSALKRAQAEADLVSLSEELAEVTRELQLAQEARLEQRNVAALSEMAAGAAHEINNPLAIISGRAQQLAAEEKQPARREMLQTIIHQASRISDILAELHEFARPPKPELQVVDPVALAKEVVAGFQAHREKPTAALRVEAPGECPAVQVDPGQVSDALREIVQNAVEACGQKNTITVSVQPLDSQHAVRFVVADNGPGMDPQVRARALDPFYSGREAGRRRGLGLPKAYRLVQASGGQMTLDSAPGKGTTVRVTFHAVGTESPAEKLLAGADLSDSAKGTRR